MTNNATLNSVFHLLVPCWGHGIPLTINGGTTSVGFPKVSLGPDILYGLLPSHTLRGKTESTYLCRPLRLESLFHFRMAPFPIFSLPSIVERQQK